MKYPEHTISESRIQLETDDIIKLELFGLATCAPGWQGFHHTHDFWELLYIMKEHEDVHKLICEDEVMENTANTLYLIPPKKQHIFCNTGTLQNKNIYVGFSYKSDAEDSLPEDLPLVIKQNSVEIVGVVSEIKEIVKNLSDNSGVGLNSKRLEIMNCVLRIVRYLSSHEEPPAGGSQALLMVGQIKEYLDNHLAQPIRIDELAQKFFISPNYLGQIFRQVTGFTVKNYQNKIRMELALELMREGTYTVSEIASKSGFSDVAYFSRRFKEYFGAPPSKIDKRK